MSQIEELKNIHLSTNGFPRLEFDDLYKEIKLLGIKRSIIPLSGVLKIYGASQLVNAYLKFFEFHNEKFQSIESVFRIPTKRMKLLMPLKIDSSGAIKDSVSSNLKNLLGLRLKEHIEKSREISKNSDVCPNPTCLRPKETVIVAEGVLSVEASI